MASPSPKISLVGRENVRRRGAPGCRPAAPGLGVATSFGSPPALNQVTGSGAGQGLPPARRGSDEDGARARLGDGAVELEDPREARAGRAGVRWVPERRLTRETCATNSSCTGSPSATSTQRLASRAFGVRTARETSNELPRIQPTGAERVIVAVTTIFWPTDS